MRIENVQGEPVYLYRRRGLHDFVTCNHERYAELSAKPHLFETKVLYAAPHPAQDVTALVEALERISKRASEAECHQAPCSPIQRLFVDIMQQADDALAAHRKRGE